MLAIERKNEILQKLRADQRVLVSELAAHYQAVSYTHLTRGKMRFRSSTLQ